MAITRIRGGQIQDRTVDGIKIKQSVLLDEHVASNAAIQESKLAINWNAHTEILEDKKVLDYVQITDQAVGGLKAVDVTSVIGASTPTTTSAGTVEGVIVDAPRNKVVVRDAKTGDPIVANTNGDEVYGKMIYTPDDTATTTNETKFEVQFFVYDTTLSTPAEVTYTMSTGQSVKMQYLRRFNLLTVDEMFAANEKFVDGSADTNARLDLQQLAKDLYGSSWSLDHDGLANLGRSLVDEILAQTSGATNTTVRASTIIDEVVAARGTFANVKSRLDSIDTTNTDQGNRIASLENEVSTARSGKDATGTAKTYASLDARLDDVDVRIGNEETNRKNQHTQHVADLAGTTTTTGANLIGTSGKFGADGLKSGLTVEGALEDLQARLVNQEKNGGAEVTATHSRDAASANGYYPVESFTSLEARLVDIENTADAEFAKAKATTDEVVIARGTFANLDARLDDITAKADTSDQEVVDARTSTALTGLAVTHASLDVRLEETEKVVKATNDEVVGARGTAASLDARLDSIDTRIGNEETNRANADTAIRNDFASTATGKGASLVGIEDAAAVFTATNAEAALKELYDKINNDVSSATTEYKAADELRTKELESVGVKSGASVGAQATPNMSVAVSAGIVYNAEGKRFAPAAGNVTISAADATNPRIDIIVVDSNGNYAVVAGTPATSPVAPSAPAGSVKLAEVNVPAGDTAIDSAQISDKRIFVGTGAEIQASRGSKATLDARLDVALNEDGTLKAGGQVHDHMKHIEQVTAQKSVVNLPTGSYFQKDSADGTFSATLNVYVNGILQANGVNFTEVYDANGNGTSIDFGTDPVLVGDVIILTWVNNNAK